MVGNNRRQFERLSLAKPILALLDGQNALILDIGVSGAFVEHYGKTNRGDRFTLLFRWKGMDVEFVAEVAHTVLVRKAGDADVSHDPDLLAREDNTDGRSNNYAKPQRPLPGVWTGASHRARRTRNSSPGPVRDVPLRTLQQQALLRRDAPDMGLRRDVSELTARSCSSLAAAGRERELSACHEKGYSLGIFSTNIEGEAIKQRANEHQRVTRMGSCSTGLTHAQHGTRSPRAHPSPGSTLSSMVG